MKDRDGASKNYEKEEIDYLKDALDKINLSQIALDEDLVKELIRGFEQLVVDLRKDIEEESPLLLQQISGELYGKKDDYPSKAIIEISPDPYIGKGAFIEKDTKAQVGEVYFTFLEEVVIWPIKIDSTAFIEACNFNEIEQSLNVKTTHLVKIVISSLNIPLRAMKLDEIRFFVDGFNGDSFITSLFGEEKCFEGFSMDSKVKENQAFSLCKVVYEIPTISEDLEVLKDFCNLPQLYYFFKIKNLDLKNIFEDMILYIPINFFKSLPRIKLKLFNFLAINKFETNTHPLTINLKETKQKLTVNPYNPLLKICEIKSIKFVSKKEELKNWKTYEVDGVTFISFLDCKNDIRSLNDQTLYGEVVVHNGEGANKVKPKDQVSLINYVNFSAFVNYSSPYELKNINLDQLHTYLNTDFKLLLNDLDGFKKHMNNLINLVMPNYPISISNITQTMLVQVGRWGNIPVPIPTKVLDFSFITNREEVWLFLNVLFQFLEKLSFSQEKIIINSTWKGKKYVVK